MNNINQLLFELIRVAVGAQDALSRPPSGEEWTLLYDMAKKQSLVGVCFAGVQRTLSRSATIGDACQSKNSPSPLLASPSSPCCEQRLPKAGEDPIAGIPEDLYYKWMGMSAKIQHRNDVVNRQCVELQKRLREDGFRSCILKGQGVGTLYQVKSEEVKSEDSSNASSTSSVLSPLGEAEGACLSLSRQSGDIDVWVDGSREEILAYINRICPTEKVGDLHAHFGVFSNTEVEVHFTPSILSNKKADKRLQEWFESEEERQMSHTVTLNDGSSITAPSIEFNLVFLLLHIFRHYLYEGVGMRQLMDYYFVLRHSDASQREEAMRVLCDLKVDSFAGALMGVLHTIFGLEEEYMLCTPDKKRGKRFLDIVLEGGNFGHSTEKYKITGWDKPLSRLSRYLRRNWYMVWDYPGEVLSHMMGKIGI